MRVIRVLVSELRVNLSSVTNTVLVMIEVLDGGLQPVRLVGILNVTVTWLLLQYVSRSRQ